MVDEVQILENNQPIRALHGVVIPKNAALNITFKSDFKGKIIHNAKLGLGPENYLIEYDQLVLRKKIKAVNYLKGNNTGTSYANDHQTHDAQDLQNEQQAEWQADKLSINTLSGPPLKPFRYEFNATAALTANLLFKNKQGDVFKINAFALRDRNRTAYQSLVKLIDANNPFSYVENMGINRKPRLAFGQLAFTRNTTRLYFNQELQAGQLLSREEALGQASRQALVLEAGKLAHSLNAFYRRPQTLWQLASFTELARNPQQLRAGLSVPDTLPQ